MRVTIARYDGVDLTRTEYTFNVDLDFGGGRVYLDRFDVSQRKTKRHGWKSVASWGTFDTRRNTTDQPTVIPADVVAELFDRITGHIRSVPITAGYPRKDNQIAKFA